MVNICVEVCGNGTFVNLHVHTSYSLLDSISKPEDIVKKIKVMNQPAVAITEHGNTFSAVKMHKLAKNAGIKHIYGCEFYITSDRFVKDKNNKYYHLTVLAMNEQGRLNINKLVTYAHTEGFYYKPRIDFDLLEAHKEGLIILSGCMAGELQQALAGGKIGEREIEITNMNISHAKVIVNRFKKAFGENYYLEVQSHSDHRQQALNREIVNLAQALQIKWVATSDSHFVEEADHDLHKVFIGIARNKDNYEQDEVYKDTQLQSVDEVRKLLKPALAEEEIDVAIRTTLEITEKCNSKVPLSAPLIPHVKVPKRFNSEEEYLKYLCQQGWNRRGINKYPPDLKKQYRERLNYEYNAIVEMGFAGYYLLVFSYANTVKRRGIARGSGGGSLVAYLTNIVDIDPIKYGLYFERFIDVGALDLLRQGIITPEELKIPDFDLDFGTEEREIVLNSLVTQYGQERVVSLGNFSYIWDKSAIKDVGRVIGVPYEVTNEITKLLGDEDIDYAIQSPLFKKYRDAYPTLFDYASKLTGLPRSFGMHPCGKVVTIQDATFYSALAENDGQLVVQMDMNDAEALGLVKCDLLGLKTINIIYDTLEMIGKDYEYINPNNLTFADDKVLDIFRQGKTNGIFQFESDGMKSVLTKMEPTGLDDLGVANALYRPGSLKYIDPYIKRKHGEEKPVYMHPDLKPILSVTYGIIVFQEQLIEIGRLAGMRNPDEIRQATAKKKIEKMKKVEPELKGGLLKRGWTQAQVDKLWEDILDFAKYSFNKAHAYSYAMIAYICAMLKAYHPVEFMTAVLKSETGNYDKIPTYFNESKSMGIEILVPHINKSQKDFTVEDGKIRFGLQAIKGVGGNAVDEILYHRGINYFNSFTDFLSRVTLDTGTMVALIQSGSFGQKKSSYFKLFFDTLYEWKDYKPVKSLPTKAKLYELSIIYTEAEFKNKEECLRLYNLHKEKEYVSKQEEKMHRLLAQFIDKYMLAPEMFEFNTLGAFLSGCPFDYPQFKDLSSVQDGDKVLLAGTIVNVTQKKQGNGGQMARITLQTMHGLYEGMAFANQNSTYQEIIKKGKNVVIKAKKSDSNFIVERMKELSEWKAEMTQKGVLQ